MKKLIVALIIGIKMFTLSAEMLKTEVSTDEKTCEMVFTATYEGKAEDDYILEIKAWKKDSNADIARCIKTIYADGNRQGVSHTLEYNYNYESGIAEKKEVYFKSSSEKRKGTIEFIIKDDKLFHCCTLEYDSLNGENILREIEVSTLDKKLINKTIYYNYKSDKESEYMEFEEDLDCLTYKKVEYKNNSMYVKTIEDFYSYPNNKYSDDNPYRQIVTYEDDKTEGMQRRTSSRNDDGTYFIEYVFNPATRKTSFGKEVSKFSRNGKILYTEGFLDEYSTKKQVYKIVVTYDDNSEIINILYYDKEGKEVPCESLGHHVDQMFYQIKRVGLGQ